MKKNNYILLMAAVLALIGCSADEQGERAAATGSGDVVELRIDVTDSEWLGETFNVTRSGETLEGLKATTGDLPEGFGYGFSLHGSGLLGADGVRRQVTWDATHGQWNSGERIYWKRTSGSETFNVYAYAPYKTTTYSVAACSPSPLKTMRVKKKETPTCCMPGRR